MKFGYVSISRPKFAASRKYSSGSLNPQQPQPASFLGIHDARLFGSVAKPTTPPPLLYKYIPPERTDVLSRRRIRYTPPRAFNDPFEIRPSITELATPGQTASLLDDEIPSFIEKTRLQLLEYGIEANEDHIETLLRSSVFPNLMAAFAAMSPDLTELFKESLETNLVSLIGILTLSEVQNDLLMWSHYAGYHQGLVIGFDAHHEWFNGRRSEKDEFYHLRKVNYSENRPSGSALSFQGTKIFLTKSAHWSYEREWRELRPLADSSETIVVHGEVVHLFAFPESCVRSIILGCQASDALREKVFQLMRDEFYSHVQIIQADMAESSFSLDFRDLSLG